MKKNIFFICLTLLMISQFANAQYSSPESAIYDAANSRYIISNAGNGTSGGNLVVVDRNTLAVTPFLTNGVNSPKGMCIISDTLFVADVTSVKAIGLTSASVLATINITGATFLNDIVYAGNGFMYVTDNAASKIFKINRSTLQVTPLPDVASAVISPNGIMLDSAANRLLFVSYRLNSPIQSITLGSDVISTFAATTVSNLDGITRDGSGNYYVSSWATNKVYRYNSTFSGSPTIVASAVDGPADIFYNKLNDTLVIPCFNSADVVFMNMAGTGIENNAYQFDVKVFPNPVKSTLDIGFRLSVGAKVSIAVFDERGIRIKDLYNKYLNANEHRLSFSIESLGLSKGIYIVQFDAGNRTMSKKIVVD